MESKPREKERAIMLRKKGLSYNEILKQVSVSKSSLSTWLKHIGLAQAHRQRFTENRRRAQERAQLACRNARIAKEIAIIDSARQQVKNISERELWFIGTALYWAEGAKQKEHNVSQKVTFSNSDPNMILLFDRWLREICHQDKTDLVYSIYIHVTADKERARKYWEKLLHAKIDRMYFKSHKPKTNRKNTKDGYFGLMRIDVRKSTDLNRKIKGWVNGITEALALS